jgi:hypothetical protein
LANLAAIRSVGTSLVTYLDHAYRAASLPAGLDWPACSFSLQTPGGLTDDSVDVSNGSVEVLVLLYRVAMNEHLRTSGRPARREMTPTPLSVDLHYLVSIWAESAENEQLMLAWTMRQLHETSVLDASILSAEAGWQADDVIHLIPQEISNEDMMRIWDALAPHYRLSLSYIARVVRIDPDDSREHREVVATRFDYAVPGDRP